MSAYQTYDHPRQPGLGGHDVASHDFLSAPLNSVQGTFHDGANPLLDGVSAGPSLFDLRQHPYDHSRHYQPVPQMGAYRQHYQLDAMRAAGTERSRQPQRLPPSLPPLSIPPPLPSLQNPDALASPPQEPKSDRAAEDPAAVLSPQGREDQKRNRDVDEDSHSDSEENRSKKTTTGRKRIMIQYIQEKSRRHITFSKRKAGIMKKAFELSTLTGTQVLLLVVSETGLVYTFATPKLQPIVTKSEGKNLIQACLNAPDYPLTPPQEVQPSLPRAYPGPHPVTPVNSVNPGFYDNLQFGGRPQPYTPISAESPTSTSSMAAAHGPYGSYPGTFR